MIRKIITVETIDEAESICRKMNVDAFNSVGITDFTVINKLISDKQCCYHWWANHIFDDVGGIVETQGYTVYKRIVV